jgi:hypothetical protein
MTQPIKLKEEELKSIVDIQSQNGKMLELFGLLYLDKMQIDESIRLVTAKEEKLQSDWVNLRKRENDFIDNLIKSYGEGSLDMKNGIFVPDETSKVE